MFGGKHVQDEKTRNWRENKWERRGGGGGNLGDSLSKGRRKETVILGKRLEKHVAGEEGKRKKN